MLKEGFTQMLPTMMQRISVIPWYQNHLHQPWWFPRSRDRNVQTFSEIKGMEAKKNTKTCGSSFTLRQSNMPIGNPWIDARFRTSSINSGDSIAVFDYPQLDKPKCSAFNCNETGAVTNLKQGFATEVPYKIIDSDSGQ
jgi:alpha-galactosidase/6-phospho-beta-glucosidase family protein